MKLNIIIFWILVHNASCSFHCHRQKLETFSICKARPCIFTPLTDFLFVLDKKDHFPSLEIQDHNGFQLIIEARKLQSQEIPIELINEAKEHNFFSVNMPFWLEDGDYNLIVDDHIHMPIRCKTKKASFFRNKTETKCWVSNWWPVTKEYNAHSV